MHRKKFDIDELKKQLFAENYVRFPDFKRNVLDIAMKEINELSDLNVSYEIEEQGRRYAKINFSIKFEKDAMRRLMKGLAAEERLSKTAKRKYCRIIYSW